MYVPQAFPTAGHFPTHFSSSISLNTHSANASLSKTIPTTYVSHPSTAVLYPSGTGISTLPRSVMYGAVRTGERGGDAWFCAAGEDGEGG